MKRQRKDLKIASRNQCIRKVTETVQRLTCDYALPFLPFLLLAVGFAAFVFTLGVLATVKCAPRKRVLPSFNFSVITGLAAGRYLKSFEYLRIKLVRVA